MPKCIPITAAARFIKEHGLHHVVIVGYDKEGRSHVVTASETKAGCKIAGAMGKFVMDAIKEGTVTDEDRSVLAGLTVDVGKPFDVLLTEFKQWRKMKLSAAAFAKARVKIDIGD